MVNSTKILEAIVIPSGSSGEENLERARTAIKHNNKMGLDVPYIISGTGDINAALYGNRIDKGSDFHRNLYEFMMKNTEGVIGMDVLSKNSEGNILNTFPREVSGRYALVSYPLHLLRMKLIVERARARGQISPYLSIEYVPTKQSKRQIIYGILALVKELAKN